jgi:hypothetical protein
MPIAELIITDNLAFIVLGHLLKQGIYQHLYCVNVVLKRRTPPKPLAIYIAVSVLVVLDKIRENE